MNAKPALVRPCFASDFDPLVALLISRLCIAFPAAHAQLNDGLYSEELRELLGLSPKEGKISKAEMRDLLRSRSAELEKLTHGKQCLVQRNIGLVQKTLGLDSLQAEILCFVALSHVHPQLGDILDNIRTAYIEGLVKLIAAALKVREVAVKNTLRSDGHLRSTHLVSVVKAGGAGLQLHMPENFCTALFSEAKNIDMLMSSFLELAPEPALTASAFPHLEEETSLLSRYLKAALDNKVKGVNVLIYGPPGTGKSEYVLWLAKSLSKQLFTVKAVDGEGKAIKGDERLASYQLAQSFLKGSNSLIFFDEIEDVFPAGDEFFGLPFSPRPAAGKLFINKLLDTNPIPGIWVANEIKHIDKAYLRRFDFSFEIGLPPADVRRSILKKHLNGLKIGERILNGLSSQRDLSPAQIGKAAKVAALSARSQKDREMNLLLAINASQSLLDQESIEAKINDPHHFPYQLDYLNPDCDLDRLLKQLKRNNTPTGAICLYGPPGTGKTALAHFIADQIDSPIVVQNGSDILSPYVGETEQKIAAMFRRAESEKAILLLDEADSFLNERKAAKNAWEISAVNEMLTQMERFRGLFVCSTNLIGHLDSAALRRFALKIRFDYLKPEQRWELFLAHVGHIDRSKMVEYRSQVSQLTNLTPGDFAAIRRQASLFNLAITADSLLRQLRQECQLKAKGPSRQMGFVHST